MSLKITKIDIYKANTPGTSFLASGSVVFNDVFFVKFVVMNGKSGPFISWPSRKGKDKDGNEKYYNDAGFIVDFEEDNETRYDTKNAFEKELIDEFNKVLAIAPKETPPSQTVDTKTEKVRPKVNWNKPKS